MLVLSREKGQRIIIRTDDGRIITFVVLEVRDSFRKVRLGIQAPAEFSVHREEVDAEIQAGRASRRCVPSPHPAGQKPLTLPELDV